MDYFAGIDASLETANVCIVDGDGVVVLEEKVGARIVGCYRSAMPIECAAELGRPSLLNPSCPPASIDAEHAKKHERIRAHAASRGRQERS